MSVCSFEAIRLFAFLPKRMKGKLHISSVLYQKRVELSSFQGIIWKIFKNEDFVFDIF